MFDQAILHKKYYQTYINKGNRLLNKIGYSLLNLKRYEEGDISFTKSIEIQNFK